MMRLLTPADLTPLWARVAAEPKAFLLQAPSADLFAQAIADPRALHFVSPSLDRWWWLGAIVPGESAEVHAVWFDGVRPADAGPFRRWLADIMTELDLQVVRGFLRASAGRSVAFFREAVGAHEDGRLRRLLPTDDVIALSFLRAEVTPGAVATEECAPSAIPPSRVSVASAPPSSSCPDGLPAPTQGAALRRPRARAKRRPPWYGSKGNGVWLGWTPPKAKRRRKSPSATA